MDPEDIRGNALYVGDTVALGVRDGNSGGLVIREIKEITHTGENWRGEPKFLIKFTSGGRTHKTECMAKLEN